MDDAARARLNLLFQKVFRSPGLQISGETTAQDVPGWDSLNHINLMMAIEREFKIKFTTREILGLKNVGELMMAIDRKLGA